MDAKLIYRARIAGIYFWRSCCLSLGQTVPVGKPGKCPEGISEEYNLRNGTTFLRYKKNVIKRDIACDLDDLLHRRDVEAVAS